MALEIEVRQHAQVLADRDGLALCDVINRLCAEALGGLRCKAPRDERALQIALDSVQNHSRRLRGGGFQVSPDSDRTPLTLSLFIPIGIDLAIALMICL